MLEENNACAVNISLERKRYYLVEIRMLGTYQWKKFFLKFVLDSCNQTKQN